MVKKYSLVLLDRDGVINKKPPTHNYILSWEDFVFLPRVKEAIALFSRADYKIAIISNQRGIARGLMTIKELDNINKNMVREIGMAGGKIDKIYFCPHDENECDCRKPKPAMVFKAIKDLNSSQESAVLLGDSFSDFETARNAGCDFIFITTLSDGIEEENKKFKNAGVKPRTFFSLYEAALWLTE